jgi:hypothetical protein
VQRDGNPNNTKYAVKHKNSYRKHQKNDRNTTKHPKKSATQEEYDEATI